MKTIQSTTNRSRFGILRFMAAGTLVLAGAALAYIGAAPKLPWAVPTVSVGNNPIFQVVDQATGTLYVAISGGNSNTIAVVNANTCNAKKTSGCGQAPATVTLSGIVADIAFDPAIHTLYVGDAN